LDLEKKERYFMKNVLGLLMLLILPAVFFSPIPDALACDCAWKGPFFDVAPLSNLIVRARVAGYQSEGKEIPAAMDLEVQEVFCGETPATPFRVWGGDGLLCRPNVTEFPVGTEWIFALDGPGAKPGMSPGRSISICGQYWLRVADGKVSGNMENRDDKSASMELPLSEFRKRLLKALTGQDTPKQYRTSVSATIRKGESFEFPFGPDFLFCLEPTELGWTAVVREKARTEDLSRLSPPLHGAINPRDIEGWHFRNSDNTGPNEPGDKNVNAPGAERGFIFSPAVGRTIDGPGAKTEPTPEEIEAVRSFGRSVLTIIRYRLDNLEQGKKAGLAFMGFSAELSWLENPDPKAECECRPLTPMF
jgi:hypothetical protein